VIYHYSYESFLPQLDLATLTPFFGRGYLAVDFFFLLSGFVIAHVYGTGFAQGVNSWRTYRHFMSARFARIYPLHLFALVLMLGLESAKVLLSARYADTLTIHETPFSNETSLVSLATNLLLLHALNLHSTLSWNEPSWSISAEWWTYTLFPFCAAFFFRLKAWSGMLIYLAGLGLLFALQRYNGNLSLTYHYGLGRCLLEFGIGVLLYRAYQSGALANLLATDAALASGAGWAAAVWYFPLADTLIIPGFSLVILATAHNRGRLGAILGRPTMRSLGDISYAVYMLQIPLQKTVEKGWKAIFHQEFGLHFSHGESWLALAALVAVLLSVAALVHRWLEIPARDYLRKRL
jgi:peptidoglycan/LPS O-acetylase OafA/YrhL